MLQTRRAQLVQRTEAAAAVALSVLLGNVRLVELPNGGSIALATLPLLAFAVVRGPRAGVLAGACAGAAHALSGGTIVHPAQLALDYLIAYAALGLAGVGSTRVTSRTQLLPGILLAMSLHLVAMVVSGMVFFATVAGSAALTYSLGYNALTVVPETLLAVWLVPPLVRAIARANPAEAWQRGLLTPPRLTPRAVRRVAPPMSVAPRAPRAQTAALSVNAAAVSADVGPVSVATSASPEASTAPPPSAAPVPVVAPGRASFVRPGPFARAALDRT